ncbi:hypothetical protein B0H11DRAFT_2237646 [Mycena galericulata]|nr:hypothetical protein B0H11DRAFT_2237646 [Mycena galericulata]
MALCDGAALRVKCIGALECLAQHAASVDEIARTAVYLVFMLPTGDAALRAGKEPMLQAAASLIDIYLDEERHGTKGEGAVAAGEGATADFYANSSTLDPLIQEVMSIADGGNDLNNNGLAMRKRMYFIMTELACIHEQFRSTLICRQQLIEEGLHICERLRVLSSSQPEGAGLDSMVP